MISQKPVKCNAVFSVMKAAWGNFGAIKMTEIADGIMVFDFESDADRDRVVDMSPWAVHGHCLNLRLWHTNQTLDDVLFKRMQLWTQVHGMSADMLNMENASNIASRIGECLATDKENEMQVRGYIRMKVDIDVSTPVCPGFWWTNDRGVDKWAQVRYERLSDFCFGCGRLGHSAQSCNLDIVPSEGNGRLPMYGPWLSCPRQRKMASWHKPGSIPMIAAPKRDPSRKTWQDMMKESLMEKDNEGTGPLVPKEEVEELERVLVPVEALNLNLAINTPKKKRVIDLNADPSDDMESPEPLPFSGDAPSHPHVDSSLTLFTQATHMSQTPGSPTIPGLAPPTTEL